VNQHLAHEPDRGNRTPGLDGFTPPLQRIRIRLFYDFGDRVKFGLGVRGASINGDSRDLEQLRCEVIRRESTVPAPEHGCDIVECGAHRLRMDWCDLWFSGSRTHPVSRLVMGHG
jgi:hypothetical protein